MDTESGHTKAASGPLLLCGKILPTDRSQNNIHRARVWAEL